MEAAYRDMVMSQTPPVVLMLNVGGGYYIMKLIPLIPEVQNGNGGRRRLPVCVCVSVVTGSVPSKE